MKSGFMGQVPILETERLILRAHRLDDFPVFASMWSDPLVTRFIGGVPSTRQQAWARMLNYAGHWSMMGYGFWAVEDKVSRQFVGEMGFADFKRELDPPFTFPELGWALRSQFHGRGLATEALKSVLAWGDKNLASKKTVCMINPENKASLKVAQKCGYHEYRRTKFQGSDIILLER